MGAIFVKTKEGVDLLEDLQSFIEDSFGPDLEDLIHKWNDLNKEFDDQVDLKMKEWAIGDISQVKLI